MTSLYTLPVELRHIILLQFGFEGLLRPGSPLSTIFRALEEAYVRRYGSLDKPFSKAFWKGNAMGNGDDPQQDSEDAPLGHLWAAALSPLGVDMTNLTIQYNDGDVIISLAPFGTDDLLLESALLAAKSPYFAAALNSKWIEGKQQVLTNDDGVPLKRFELVFDSDGSTSLQGRKMATPGLQRLFTDNEALLRSMSPDRRLFDDARLNNGVHCRRRHAFARHGHDEAPDAYRRTAIEAHKIGFAILLDLPFELEQLPSRPSNSSVTPLWASTSVCRDLTLLVHMLLQFADLYSTIDTMAPALSDLIMNTAAFAEEISEYAGTYLRIACILRSKPLFDQALVVAAQRNKRHRLADLCGDLVLEKLVLQAALDLEENAKHAFHWISEYETYAMLTEYDELYWAADVIRSWQTSKGVSSREDVFKWFLDRNVVAKELVEVYHADSDATLWALVVRSAQIGDRVEYSAHTRAIEDEKAVNRLPSNSLTEKTAKLIEDHREVILQARQITRFQVAGDGTFYDARTAFEPYTFMYPWENVKAEEARSPTMLTLLYEQSMQESRKVPMDKAKVRQ